MVTTVSRSGRRTNHTTDDEKQEFSSYVRGDHPDQKSYHRYVLAQLRAGYRRAQHYAEEIRLIGEMLKQNLVDDDVAMELLAETHALYLIQPAEPPCERIEKSNE